MRILLVGAERVLLRRLGDFAAPSDCAALFFGIGALVLLPFAGLGQVRSWDFLRLAVPSGCVYAVAYWFYVSALAGGEVAAVAPIGSTAALLVVLLAAAVHREPLTPGKLAGAGLIAAGTVFLQRRPGPRGGAGRAGWQMLAYAGLTAVTRMLDKAQAGAAAVAPAAAYGLVVFAVVGAAQLGLCTLGGGLVRLWAVLRARPVLALGAGACNGLSFLLLLLALTRLPVSVAEPVTALSLLVTAALAALWLREPVGARWLPTVAIVAGSWLLVAEGLRAVPALRG